MFSRVFVRTASLKPGGMRALPGTVVHWILPDLKGFYKWVFDSFGLLNEFVRQGHFSEGSLF